MKKRLRLAYMILLTLLLLTSCQLLPKDDCATYGHAFTILERREPTCTEEGRERCVCDICGHEESFPVPASGHHFPEGTALAYREEGGHVILSGDCRDCQAAFEKKAPPFTDGIFWRAEVTEATLTVPEKIVYTSSDGTVTVWGDAPADRYTYGGVIYSGLTYNEEDGSYILSMTREPGATAVSFPKLLCGSIDLDTPYGRGLIKSLLQASDGLIRCTLEEGFTTIDPKMFYRTPLKEISLPDSISSIGEKAFLQAEALTSLNLSGAESIPKEALMGCLSLKTVTLSGRLRSIGESAFYGCTSLLCLDLRSVETIGNHAFSESAIERVTLGRALRSVGDEAFLGCESLSRVEAEAGEASGTLTLGRDVFRYCYRLTSVAFPEGLLTIPDNLFSFEDEYIRRPGESLDDELSSVLVSVTLPSSVTSIGEKAFYLCRKLSLTSLPSNLREVKNSAFAGCNKVALSLLPDGLCEIGYYAFNGCALTFTTLPSAMKEIPSRAFSNCHTLESVTLPSGVKVIEAGAFSGCSALSTVILPDGLTTIGDSAFESCAALTTLSMPDSVSTIGRAAFSGCTALTLRALPSSLKTLGSHAFYQCESLELEAMPEALTEIPSYAFYGCRKIGRLTENPRPNVFYRTLDLSHVTHIGELAFSQCRDLHTLRAEHLLSIGLRAFDHCQVLRYLFVSSEAISIGESAFQGIHPLSVFYCQETLRLLDPVTGEELSKETLFPYGTFCLYAELTPTAPGTYWRFNSEGEAEVYTVE